MPREMGVTPIPIESLTYPKRGISVKRVDAENIKTLTGDDLPMSNLVIRNEVIANSTRIAAVG